MSERALQRDVLVAFEFAHNRDDFVNPLTNALAGVSVRDALFRPDTESKGIWDVVLHTNHENARVRIGPRVC